MIKKLLSAVTAVIVLSSVTLSAAAAAADSAEGGTGKAAPAGFMEYLGIISGKTDVLYTQTVKRGDFAEYLAKLLKYTAAADADGRYFTDVTGYDYAEAAINYLTDADIISVPDDRKFRPAEDITTEEAVKMVVCALGYRPMAEARGGFPSGYNRAARQYSLLKNVGGERFTLNDAAQLLFNALITPLYSVASVSGSEGEYTYEYKVMPENTLLHNLYSMGCTQNVLTGADGIDVWTEKQSDDNSVVIGGEIYKTESAADFTEYLGMDVFGIYGCETDELVYVFPSSYGRSRIVTIGAEDYISFSGDQIRYVKNSGGSGEKTVTADIKDAVLLYNGAVPKRNTQEIMDNL
ncbi:MAG: S-layer homology domain-containing protein, partial [Clostridia bacterium]|nr:S-layer homology domain-containing protein [Clostridia bacterium]